MVTITSAAVATSSVQALGSLDAMSMLDLGHGGDRGRFGARSGVGPTGVDVDGVAAEVPSQPAAICERPALCTQRNSTAGRPAAGGEAAEVGSCCSAVSSWGQPLVFDVLLSVCSGRGVEMAVMRWSSSASAASNALPGPDSTGSGIDQWSQCGRGLELLVGPVAHRDHQVGLDIRRVSARGVLSPMSRPARRAAATAPGWTRSAGWVPALAAPRRFGATARPPAGSGPSCGCRRTGPARLDGRSDRQIPQATAEPHVAAPAVAGGDVPVTSPTRSRTSRWWASRLPARPNCAASAGVPVGDGEVVDDREPHGLAQRRVHGRPPLDPTSPQRRR